MGKPDVSKETAKRIQDMALQLHYSPLMAAQQLRSGHSYIIGAVMQQPESQAETGSYMMEILMHLIEALDKHGYDLNVIPETTRRSNLTLYDRTCYRNYDGVILLSANQNEPQIQELVGDTIPLISIESEISGVTCISSDWQDSTYKPTKQMMKKGCQRIAMICGNDCPQTRAQIRGYERALRDPDASQDGPLLLENADEDSLISFLRDTVPDGILFADRTSCKIGLDVLWENRWSDIHAYFCGSDSAVMAANLNRYYHNSRKIAEETVRKLVLDIDLGTRVPERILVQGQLDCPA